MAKASKKTSAQTEVKSPQLELVPIKQSHSLFWNSTLFSDVYLQNDVPVVYDSIWNRDDSDFEQFLEQFRNHCEEFKTENPNAWSERTTIDRAIKPVLRMLGWKSSEKSSVDPWLEDESFTIEEASGVKTYKPDFIVVDNHKELKYIQEKSGQAKLEEARRQSNAVGGVILTIEAKYWDRIEDHRQNRGEDKSRSDKTDKSESSRGLEFDEQCLKYMEMLQNPYGILTDGKTWRLYSYSASSPSNRPYFQFNLGYMIRHVNNSDFLSTDSNPDYFEFREQMKYFYFIFRKESLSSSTGKKLFVDDLLDYSKKYVAQVEEDLKTRFVNAMSIACNGFHRAARAAKVEIDLETIRNISESHIFNILFLKYCEARNILPIKQDPEGYRTISISNMLDKLEGFKPEKEKDGLNYSLLKARFSEFKYSPDGAELYARLLRLTTIVQSGNREEFKGFAIKGFKSSIFAKQEWKFAQDLKLSNQEMVCILFELGFAKNSDVPGKTYQQIPYNVFTPRQLGSIYESFLEFRLEKASQDMAYVKSQWSPANLESEKVKAMDVPKVKKGSLFFSPDNKDRKATGSYYTPDYVVQSIVSNTIGPRIADLSSKELLSYVVCDPAMGSGHFLSASLNFLAKAYLLKLEKETYDDVALTLVDAKRLVLKSCIFGIDINSRAVKLAKMSLWLESATSSDQLDPLDDQIITKDTLSDSANLKSIFPTISSKGGFDAIVGNPPYRRELDYKELFDVIATYKLGQKYRSPRMDLWYYFVHRGIEYLKDGCPLSFITNAYWVAGTGAEKLIEQLKNETQIEEIVYLRDLKVFDDVSGQHMIFRIVKGSGDGPTIVRQPPETKLSSAEPLFSGAASFVSYEKSHQSLFRNGKLDIQESDDGLLAKIESGTRLGELGEIRQGIAENPASIGKKVNEKYGRRWKVGQGVFALTESEVRGLKLNKDENKLLRSYHDLCDLGRYWVAEKPSKQLIYSTKSTCPSLENLKNIKAHLSNFKVLMDARRETQNGSNSWWHLHWPRDEEIWNSDRKIVSVQMGRRPIFSNCTGPLYVPFSVNVFVPSKSCSLSLDYILGILNSKLLWKWFAHSAKRRGVGLEINGGVLKMAPIKTEFKNPSETKLKDEIASKVTKVKEKVRRLRADGNSEAEIEAAISAQQSEIDQAVFKLYGLTQAEIKALEKTFASEETGSERVQKKAA